MSVLSDHCFDIMELVVRDGSFPPNNPVNFALYFVNLRGSLQPYITVNSAVNSQLKENQICCSEYPMYIDCYYSLVLTVNISVTTGNLAINTVNMLYT